jgi:hypothetical protein
MSTFFGLHLVPGDVPEKAFAFECGFYSFGPWNVFFPLRRALVNLCELLKLIFGFRIIGVCGLVFIVDGFFSFMVVNS